MPATDVYITPVVGSSDEYQAVTALPLAAAAVAVAKVAAVAAAAGVGTYVGYRVARALFH